MADMAYVRSVLQRVERELVQTPDSMKEHRAMLTAVKLRGHELMEPKAPGTFDQKVFDAEVSQFLDNVKVLLPNM